MDTATIEHYYANNGERIKKMIDNILTRYGGISDKDKDDFYSIGNEVFVLAMRSYDVGKSSFNTYLKNCISHRIKNEMTRRNRLKRSADVSSIDDGYCSIDVADNKSFEDEILSDEAARDIYRRLPRVGKKIVDMRLSGKTDSDIKKELKLNNKDFDDELKKMRMVVAKYL